MSTTKVTLNDGQTSETLLVRGATVADVLQELEDGPKSDVEVLRELLEKTGIELSVPRPDSSWISEERFDQANGEIIFVTADDLTPMPFSGTLEDFLAGVATGEAGRWYHRLKGTYSRGR